MKTKLHIIIGGTSHEIDPTDIRNWDELSFTLERKDYSGVVRSFSSQFQFVGSAFTLLRGLYLADGFLAAADVAVSTKNNDWTYTEQFRCPLDFSSLEIEGGTLTVNAVDNTLAALFKSKKGQKYEFPMSGFSLTYINLQRMAFGNSAKFTLPNESPSAGHVDARLDENASTVISTEYIEPTDESSGYDGTGINRFFAKVNKAPSPLMQIYVTGTVRCWLNPNYHATLDPNGDIYVASMQCVTWTEGNSVAHVNATLFNNDIAHKRIYGINREMWIGRINHTNYCTLDELKAAAASHVYGLYPGMFGVVGSNAYPNTAYWTDNEIYEYQAGGTWVAKGAPGMYYQDRLVSGSVSIQNLATTQCVGLELDYAMDIKDGTMTVTWTDPARLSMSFGAITPLQLLGAIVNSIAPTATASIAEDAAGVLANTYIIPAEALRRMADAKVYSTFQQFAEWMEAVFGYTYRVNGSEVRFMHRAEVFNGDAVKVIDNVRDVKYSVDDSIIYSEVDAGYSKKEYGEINGRLEKNFTNYYATDYNATDKKLSLISKYRADIYGIEFTLRKGEKQGDTTDDKSDEDVFVICAKDDNGTVSYLTADNAAYSPAVCVANNAAYIAAMGNGNAVRLTMTSSDGDNALEDVTIAANTALFTAGKLSFTTDDMTLPQNWNGLVQVEHDGWRLRGFVAKAEARFGRSAGMDYELIISDITEL